MSSNNEGLSPAEAQAAGFSAHPKAERTLMDRIYHFVHGHRKNMIIRVPGALCAALCNITDTRGFMIAMHAISFSMAAVCIWMAFRTGRYPLYFSSAATIAVLSCVWPKFTTRAMEKWRKAQDKIRGK